MWEIPVLETIIRESTSFRDFARRLGTNHRVAKKLALEHGLITEHFKFGKVYSEVIGKCFNNLTINSIFKNTKSRWMCSCICACGRSGVIKRLDSVIGGVIVSCGCFARYRPSTFGSKNKAFRGCGELRAMKIREIVRSANRRGLEFSITKEYLWDLFILQNKKCAITGIDLYFGRVHYPNETNASLDRIDSSKGYVIGNVQWVLKDINRIKLNLDQLYFIDLCKMVAINN